MNLGAFSRAQQQPVRAEPHRVGKFISGPMDDLQAAQLNLSFGDNVRQGHARTIA